MKRFANYAVRTIALFAAAQITSLTLFVHAVDRERLGASVATLPSIVAQSHDAAMSSATLDNAQPVLPQVFARSGSPSDALSVEMGHDAAKGLG